MQDQQTHAGTTELRAGDLFAGHRIEGVLGRGGTRYIQRSFDSNSF